MAIISSLSCSNIKQNIRNSFGKSANRYAEYANVQKKAARILFEKIIKQINSQKNLQIIGTILEIGSGTGLLSEHVVSYFKNAEYFISDISHEMVKKCKKNILHPAHTLVCDGELPPFRNNSSMDLIISNMSFHWFQEFTTSIKKLFAMTNILAFSIPISGTFNAWENAHKTLGLQNKIMEFYSIYELKNILLQYKPKTLLLETIELSENINSAFEFLQYLKLIGATPKLAQDLYSVADLRKLCQEVDSYNSNVIVNYKIAICILKKI